MWKSWRNQLKKDGFEKNQQIAPQGETCAINDKR
jgi:hypothetical protein